MHYINEGPQKYISTNISVCVKGVGAPMLHLAWGILLVWHFNMLLLALCVHCTYSGNMHACVSLIICVYVSVRVGEHVHS